VWKAVGKNAPGSGDYEDVAKEDCYYQGKVCAVQQMLVGVSGGVGVEELDVMNLFINQVSLEVIEGLYGIDTGLVVAV
jgi:hypothetical protein